MYETVARPSNSPEGIPDLHEAKELIRQAVMAKTRNMPLAEKDNAARALLQELRELGGFCGIQITSHGDDLLEMSLFEVKANITNSGGTVRVQLHVPNDAQPIDVPLDLDPETSRFIGIELDRFRTPVPGLPIARRPAVAVVVETAMKVLSGPPQA